MLAGPVAWTFECAAESASSGYIGKLRGGGGGGGGGASSGYIGRLGGGGGGGAGGPHQATHPTSLKGLCHEIFDPRFFSSNNPP
jgi:hypothetical protein